MPVLIEMAMALFVTCVVKLTRKLILHYFRFVLINLLIKRNGFQITKIELGEMVQQVHNATTGCVILPHVRGKMVH